MGHTSVRGSVDPPASGTKRRAQSKDNPRTPRIIDDDRTSPRTGSASTAGTQPLDAAEKPP
ncbi:hypothetical protein GCM10010411_37470 [Actinomadura fulvescens]|uniref:Uncharacterized protein n=1 Tax=Actinomadura fulvescens TaxID=46160 RepID=A0ABP6C3B2_9ACTN